MVSTECLEAEAVALSYATSNLTDPRSQWLQSRLVSARASVGGLFFCKTRKERRARSAGQLRDGDGASAPSTSSTSCEVRGWEGWVERSAAADGDEVQCRLIE